MKKAVLFLCCFVMVHLCNAQAPSFQWAKSFGGTGIETGYSVTTDVPGNVIVAGTFKTYPLVFASSTLTYAGDADIMVLKYDANGNEVWAQSAGGSAADAAESVIADANGNIIVTGWFMSATIAFGSTILTNTGTPGTEDMFVAKYDANGVLLWVHNASGGAADYSYSASADASGNIFIAGSSSSTSITFGSITLVNTGAENMFVVKYDSGGNAVWAKKATGSSNCRPRGITTDATGNILVTGLFQNATITFGTITLTNAGAANTHDIFLLKYDNAGNELWAKRAGGTNGDFGISVATDLNSNVIVGGYFNSTTFPFASTTLNNAGGLDIFILKYDVNGNELWAHSAGGSSSDWGFSVDADMNGNIVLTGYFQSISIAFGATTLNQTGASDIFLVKYDQTGNVLWAKGTEGSTHAYSVTIDANDNIFLTGDFVSTTATFDSDTLNRVGVNDLFVAKLNIATGIESADRIDLVSIYPNPATDNIFIQSPGILLNVNCFNYAGQAVDIKIENSSIDISSFPAGLYFLVITFDGGNQFTQKFIKR